MRAILDRFRAWLWGALVLALCAALAAFGVWMYRTGYAAAEGAAQARLLAQIEAGQDLEEQRRKIAVERDTLARKLEEAAYADPVVVDRCLGPDRVRRLNAIR